MSGLLKMGATTERRHSETLLSAAPGQWASRARAMGRVEGEGVAVDGSSFCGSGVFNADA